MCKLVFETLFACKGRNAETTVDERKREKKRKILIRKEMFKCKKKEKNRIVKRMGNDSKYGCTGELPYNMYVLY